MSADEPQTLPERVRQARLRLAQTATEFGAVLVLHGRHAEAEALLRRAIAIYESTGATKECER